MYSEPELKVFDRVGLKRPEHISHGVAPQDLGNNMRQLKPRGWRLEGNKLIGQTDMGPLVQTIPADYILIGTGQDGLPIFQKVVIQHN